MDFCNSLITKSGFIYNYLDNMYKYLNKLFYMSWLKLNLVKYDISNIYPKTLFPSFIDYTIKDNNLNDVIRLPQFNYDDNDMYRISIIVKDIVLQVNIFINFKLFCNLLKSYSPINNRNELFFLFKHNIELFKFNTKIFNSLKNSIIEYNSLNINNLNKINANYNDTISYQYKHVNIITEEYTNKQNLPLPITIHNIVLYCIGTDLTIKVIKKLCTNVRTLVVYSGNITNYKSSLSGLEFTKKSNKTIDLENSNLIYINVNIIKNKSYFQDYSKYHTTNKDLAYKRYKNNKTDFINNIELIDFDQIIFIDTIHNNIVKNKNLIEFLSLVKNTKNIFLEKNLINKKFTYEYYKTIRNLICNQQNISDCVEVNKSIILNNIVPISQYINCGGTGLVNINFKNYTNFIKFFYNISKIKVLYSLYYTPTDNNICPITYNKLSDNLQIRLSCGHKCNYFAMQKIIQLKINKCPICANSIVNTKIMVCGSKQLLSNIFGELFVQIIKNVATKAFVILNDNRYVDLLNNVWNLLSDLLSYKTFIKFIFIDSESKFSDKTGVYYVFDNDFKDIFFKLKLLDKICANDLTIINTDK